MSHRNVTGPVLAGFASMLLLLTFNGLVGCATDAPPEQVRAWNREPSIDPRGKFQRWIDDIYDVGEIEEQDDDDADDDGELVERFAGQPATLVEIERFHSTRPGRTQERFRRTDRTFLVDLPSGEASLIDRDGRITAQRVQPSDVERLRELVRSRPWTEASWRLDDDPRNEPTYYQLTLLAGPNQPVADPIIWARPMPGDKPASLAQLENMMAFYLRQAFPDEMPINLIGEAVEDRATTPASPEAQDMLGQMDETIGDGASGEAAAGDAGGGDVREGDAGEPGVSPLDPGALDLLGD